MRDCLTAAATGRTPAIEEEKATPEISIRTSSSTWTAEFARNLAAAIRNQLVCGDFAARIELDTGVTLSGTVSAISNDVITIGARRIDIYRVLGFEKP
ncbi:hypothetical protein ABFV47_32825 [Mycolicibacterium fortuitum]|uniref:hypothetical protein n=1 Tax=Mycolicibacterium TaxID=1866885 RepID=UPI003204DCF3